MQVNSTPNSTSTSYFTAKNVAIGATAASIAIGIGAAIAAGVFFGKGYFHSLSNAGRILNIGIISFASAGGGFAALALAGVIVHNCNRRKKSGSNQPNFKETARKIARIAQFNGLKNDQPLPATEEDLVKSWKFLNNPLNKDFLRGKLNGLGTQPYVILEPSETSLRHRIEYFPSGKAYLRYQSTFATGAYRECSRHVDLESGALLVKSRIYIENLVAVNAYRDDKRKPRLAELMPMATIEKERQFLNGKLKDVPEALGQVGHVQYKKGNKIAKIGIYSEQQDGTLADVISFSPQQKAEICRKAVIAVANFHRKGICHNDIKPDNILYSFADGQFSIKLIDYQFLSEIINNRHFHAGSPPYVTDDVYNLHTNVYSTRNVAKDAWALGVTILEIFNKLPYLAHDVIYDRNERAQAIQRLMLKPEETLADIPRDLRGVVVGLLNNDFLARLTPIEATFQLQKA